MVFTFHVPALPHTVTGDPRFSSCAFTGIAQRFASAMTKRGHRVIHYGNEGSVVDMEHVEVFSRRQQEKLFGKEPWWKSGDIRAFPWREESFTTWNAIAREEIARRASARDFVCIIGGRMQSELASIPGTLGVEYSIGHPPKGSFTKKHRAFVSHAWMNYCYGVLGESDGQFTDTVIYPPVDPSEFDCQESKGDYLLFLGAVSIAKGIHIAIEVARDAGVQLVVAGGGEKGTEPWVDYRGVVGPHVRRELLAGARAVIMPTTYLEPFGLVALEAMMSDTPVITTDFGAFTETVEHGVTGFRCRRHEEFLDAVRRAGEIEPGACRSRAIDLSCPARVAERYETWFAQLSDLWEKGYYTERKADR